MGASKSEAFSAEQQNLAALAKALAHPARIAIIQHLLQVDSCICGDLVHELPLSQPTISKHLKELKLAGIIKGNIEGSSICYCIHPNQIAPLHSFISQLLKCTETNSSCC